MVEKRGRNSTSRGSILFDSLYRRTRAAEKRSAPPPARASPTANSAAVGISDIRSRDREAFCYWVCLCGDKPDQAKACARR
jgi:hypothetical protein